MSTTEAKRILDSNGLTPVDVAAATKLHPQTVEKFLKGGSVHRGNALLIENYLRQVQAKAKTAMAANA